MSELGLYYNKECTTPVKRDEDDVWQINFGKVDVGSAKAGVLWLKNRTIGVVESIEVKAGKPNRRGVESIVRPEDPTKTSLQPLEVMKLYLHLKTEEGIPAGSVKTGLTVTAMLTEEEISPDEIA